MINKLKKQALRKQLLIRRNTLSQQVILEKSNIITNTFINFDKYRQSENIMLYVSTKKEVQTEKIIKNSQKYNKKIFIPLIDQEKIELIPSLIYDFNELALGSLKIYQPKEEFYRLHSHCVLDLVVVPGIAFTERGHRLGRGKGYYDRFLKKLNEDVSSIGLAFEMQIVNEIPVEKNDMPVDYIITEKRIIQVKDKA